MTMTTKIEMGMSLFAGAGELHLEICLNDLQGEYMGGAAINVSDPVVSYRECVTERSDHTVMAKSPNKHNRIYLEGRPLEDGLAEKIDEGDIGPQVCLSSLLSLSFISDGFGATNWLDCKLLPIAMHQN